ncbi:hypothetical protein BJ741DRAFT_601117 [Chytriomyces cf. hyalinus JEL632]|nr:hypothetical protein BJ741DRAFT_601117 [Chytriomyces cf. hyalinus JEL632]
MDWTMFPAPAAPVPPPTDEKEKDQIHTVAEAVARNDPAFLYMMMDRESKKQDSQCRFLWPNSPSYPYFAFKVWSYRRPNEYLDMIKQSSIATNTDAAAKLDFSALTPLLQKLVTECSKSNIQNARSWILKNCVAQESVESLMSILATTMEACTKFQERLHVLYLINDLLFNEIQKGIALVTPNISSNLAKFLSAAISAPDIDEAKREKVSKILSIWSSKDVFPASVLAVAAFRMANPQSVPVVASSSVERAATTGKFNPSAAYARPVSHAAPDATTLAPARPVVVPQRYAPQTKYCDVPAGLLCTKIPMGSTYYSPIPVSAFNDAVDPSLFDSKPLASVMTAFYAGLEKQAIQLRSNVGSFQEKTVDEDSTAQFDLLGWDISSGIETLIRLRREKRKEPRDGDLKRGRSRYSSDSDSQSDSRSSSRSSTSSYDRYRKRRRGSGSQSRSRSPPRSQPRDRSMSMGWNQQNPGFDNRNFTQHGPSNDGMFDAFRSARSYTFNRDPVRRRGDAAACFRCGKSGHIAKNCDDVFSYQK